MARSRWKEISLKNIPTACYYLQLRFLRCWEKQQKKKYYFVSMILCDKIKDKECLSLGPFILQTSVCCWFWELDASPGGAVLAQRLWNQLRSAIREVTSVPSFKVCFIICLAGHSFLLVLLGLYVFMTTLLYLFGVRHFGPP